MFRTAVKTLQSYLSRAAKSKIQLLLWDWVVNIKLTDLFSRKSDVLIVSRYSQRKKKNSNSLQGACWECYWMKKDEPCFAPGVTRTKTENVSLAWCTRQIHLQWVIFHRQKPLLFLLVVVLIINCFLLPGLNIKELISQPGRLCKRADSMKRTQFHNAEELHGMPWLLWVGRAELAVNVLQPGSSTNPQRKDGFSTPLIHRAAHKLLLRLEEVQPEDLQRIERKRSQIIAYSVLTTEINKMKWKTDLEITYLSPVLTCRRYSRLPWDITACRINQRSNSNNWYHYTCNKIKKIIRRTSPFSIL